MKASVTVEQAISILPDGKDIHTFYNPGFGLIGADFSREKLIDRLRKSDFLELTGERAKGMNHGLCAYDKTAKYQSDIVFIETDPKRLEKLEAELATVQNKEDVHENN